MAWFCGRQRKTEKTGRGVAGVRDGLRAKGVSRCEALAKTRLKPSAKESYR